MGISTNTHFIYTVQQGDTLYSIANQFSSTSQAIADANYLYPPVANPGMIFPGQILVIPSRVTTTYASTFYHVSPGDTLNQLSTRFSANIELIAGINEINNPDSINIGQQLVVPAKIYNVEPGDNLYQIEQRFGIHRSNIIRANLGRPGFSPETIWPGFSLIIPLPTSENIAVITPVPGTVLMNNQQIAGWARAFEGNVLHQVRDSNGVVVSNERSVTASLGAPAYGWFQSSLPFDQQPTSNVGEIWVYTRSPRDNEIQDLVRLSVYFGANL